MILQYDELSAETKAAVLLKFGDDNKWVPKSQITGYDDDTGNWTHRENNQVEIPDWLAEKKGLEAYAVDE